MKKSCRILLVASLLCACLSAALFYAPGPVIGPVTREVQEGREHDGDMVRLLSWNVFLVPHPAKNLHRPACRASAMRDIFTSYDVIALQETFDRTTTAALGESLLTTHPHQLLSLPHGRYTKLNGGLSLLSRYPILSHKTIEYEACHGRWSDCRARRGALIATIDAPVGPLDVVVTHLDAGGATGDHLARHAQLAQLHEALRSRGFASGERPLILLGDLNIDGISSRGRDDEGGRTRWAQMLEALGHKGAAKGRYDRGLPIDLFWREHAPWPMTEEATSRANTYACLATSLERCDDTFESSRWMHRARYDYALWWPSRGAARGPVPTSIEHLAFHGEPCDMAYLSDHLAVQVELRSP